MHFIGSLLAQHIVWGIMFAQVFGRGNYASGPFRCFVVVAILLFIQSIGDTQHTFCLLVYDLPDDVPS